MAQCESDRIDSEELVESSSVLGTTSKVQLDEPQDILQEYHNLAQLHDSEELMASLHLDQRLMFIWAFVLCVIIQFGFGSEGVVVGFVSTLERLLLLVVVMDLSIVWLYSTRPTFAGLETYLRTAVAVLQDYAILVTLNRKFIEIAILPFAMLVFIGAFASKVGKYRSGEDAFKEGQKIIARELIKMARVPYFLQLCLMVCSEYKGKVEEGNMFVFTSFLLFLGSALSALTVMLALPPIADSPGVDQVLPVMHKTCIVILMMTGHSMAVEWLWEDMVFACMPQLVSVLACFLIYCHRPQHVVSINRPSVIIEGSVGAILACLASLYAEDMIGPRSWFVRVFWISSSSSALSYLDVWLLDQWPTGSTQNSSGGLVQLLKFSSVISSCVSAGVAPAYYRSLISPSSQLMLPFSLSMLAMLLGWLAIGWTQIKIKRWVHLTHRNRICDMLHMRMMSEDRSRMKQMWMDDMSKDQSSKNEMWRMDDMSENRSPKDELSRMEEMSENMSPKDEMSENLSPRVELLRMDEMSENLADKDEMSEDRSPKDELSRMDEMSENLAPKDELSRMDEMFKNLTPKDELSHIYDEVDWNIKNPPAAEPHVTGLYEKDTEGIYLENIILAYTASKRPEVVCIFGLGRCNKTDTASKVYERIKGKFDCHLSVKVGLNPDIAKLIKNMITQVNCEYIGTSGAGDVNQLTQTLRLFFRNKRYLVMLDDLWSNEDWRTVKSCFAQGNPRSRIIITTRFEDAAKATGDHFYFLPAPVEADVEKLFSENFLLLQWNTLEQMKQLIKVRYNDLCADKRTCLLYLSIFPEKYEVEIERLVRLWLALGLGMPSTPFTEEIARSCIKELIARKLIKEASYEYDGTLSGCTVHPLIHEFIVCQATKNDLGSFVHKEERDVQWLSLQKSTKAAENDGVDLSNVQSVTAFGQASEMPLLTELQSQLRVLDLEGCEGPLCLDGLCKLLCLRYLSLRGTHVSELPERIGELIYLKTLDVRSTEVKKLPPSIVRLQNLMHLLAGNAELPPGISKMKALVTLSCASTMESSTTVSIKELGEIASLRELELFLAVTQRSEDKSLPSNLENNMSEDVVRARFLADGFQSLNKLTIQCGFTSVIFEIDALPKVEVLELKFNKELPEESAAVSGIDHLRSLQHVLLEFSHNGRGTEATLAEVNRAANDERSNHPIVYWNREQCVSISRALEICAVE